MFFKSEAIVSFRHPEGPQIAYRQVIFAFIFIKRSRSRGGLRIWGHDNFLRNAAHAQLL